jgi:hypothetical protein
MSRYDDMPPEKLEELRRMIEEMDTIEVSTTTLAS